MMMKRWMAGVLFLSAAVVGADLTFGQNYPNKTIHIYTSEAGAANDFTARLIAQGLAGPLGQSVVVDNRPEVLAIEIAMRLEEMAIAWRSPAPASGSPRCSRGCRTIRCAISCRSPSPARRPIFSSCIPRCR